MTPSIRLARAELKAQGVQLDIKTVRRVAEQFGELLLALRRRDVLAFRDGTLPRTRDLAGRRVVMQIDGGRIRIRKTRKKKGKNGRRKFKTKWREPKVLTIFTIDESGKMESKNAFRLIDGTLQGPDHLAELAACHLWRLGAGDAESVTFVADGAPWIWERLKWIVKRAGIPAARVSEVLDFYHGSQHIGAALKACGVKGKDRKREFANLRKSLKRGHWRVVVQRLLELGGDEEEGSSFWTEIAYLKKHGTVGRLAYGKFRGAGLPIGSGAIESTIRRSINLRLKGNSMYWCEENAESLFSVRALLLTESWDSATSRMRASQRLASGRDWQWSAPATVQELKSESPVEPPGAKPRKPQLVTSA